MRRLANTRPLVRPKLPRATQGFLCTDQRREPPSSDPNALSQVIWRGDSPQTPYREFEFRAIRTPARRATYSQKIRNSACQTAYRTELKFQEGRCKSFETSDSYFCLVSSYLRLILSLFPSFANILYSFYLLVLSSAYVVKSYIQASHVIAVR